MLFLFLFCRQIFLKKHFSFAPENISRQNRKNSGLNYLRIRMRRKHFIRHIRTQMKRHWNENISIIFIIEPVHNNHKNWYTQDKIEPINRSFNYNLILIISLHKAKRQMPQNPINRKNHRSRKKRKSLSKRISSIRMPRKLLNNWRKHNQKPRTYQHSR